VNTSPFSAPPPNNGLAKSLEEAKQWFRQRYEEMKAHEVKSPLLVLAECRSAIADGARI
jgi:hypothetical protein